VRRERMFSQESSSLTLHYIHLIIISISHSKGHTNEDTDLLDGFSSYRKKGQLLPDVDATWSSPLCHPHDDVLRSGERALWLSNWLPAGSSSLGTV
jgi:hypothetical protein